MVYFGGSVALVVCIEANADSPLVFVPSVDAGSVGGDPLQVSHSYGIDCTLNVFSDGKHGNTTSTLTCLCRKQFGTYLRGLDSRLSLSEDCNTSSFRQNPPPPWRREAYISLMRLLRAHPSFFVV